MKKNYNNKKRRYQRYFLFAAALICLIILINIGLIYAQESKGAIKGELLVEIKRGAGDLNLVSPTAFTVDSAENVLICDCGAKKVLKVNASDRKVFNYFSYAGTEIGDNHISNIAASRSGYIYLADAESNLVHKFSADGKYIGVIGRDKEKKLIKKIRYIFTDNSSNLVVIDSLEHKILLFDEDMKPTGEIRIPISDMIFSYVCGTDDSNSVYISSLKGNKFDVMKADDIKTPLYSKQCSPEEKEAIIAECRVIGFDAKNNAYAKAYLVDKNGEEVAHYLVKFVRETQGYKKLKISPGRDQQHIKILKPFVVLSEDVVLSYEIDSGSFRLLAYKF